MKRFLSQVAFTYPDGSESTWWHGEPIKGYGTSRPQLPLRRCEQLNKLVLAIPSRRKVIVLHALSRRGRR